MPKPAVLLLLSLLITKNSFASGFTERQEEAIARARSNAGEQNQQDIDQGNHVLRARILAFAGKNQGLTDSQCKVATNYYCGNGPCTPYGSAIMSIEQALSSHSAALEGCDIHLGNDLDCHVDTQTSLGEFYNFSAACQKRSNVRLWAICYDAAKTRIHLCY